MTKSLKLDVFMKLREKLGVFEVPNIDEVKRLIGPIVDKLPTLCSEAEISRYLRTRNWNSKKAGKKFKDSIKWRLEYKPERIRWENVANEAETGKIYRANYCDCDKCGRTVLIMRPGFQNTNAVNEQILYLVYCMENAIWNLNPDQEQMVWLIDFQLWNSSSISLKVSRETAKVLQIIMPRDWASPSSIIPQKYLCHFGRYAIINTNFGR
ncbi:hypothetical protein ACLB2K_007091 [Fragaria x ananassa]